MKNWSKHYEFDATRVCYPKSVAEIQELVASSSRLHVSGSGHTFNALACANGGTLLSLRYLNRLVQYDLVPDRPAVTIEAGMTYGQLCPELASSDWALANLASLAQITVAGACATATHGSGDANQGLSAAVSAIEMVDGRGELFHVSRQGDPDRFAGMVVSLGALGVVTKLTLAIVPAFQMRQEVFENLPFEAALADFDAIMGSSYSVSLFTDWQQDCFGQVWRKHRLEDLSPGDLPHALALASRATTARHPAAGFTAENCTEQLNAVGAWCDRLTHFRRDAVPSVGTELQSEYLVPREHAVSAMRAVQALRTSLAPVLIISEIRSIAADELWMSPCYQLDCVGIHFTWKNEWPNVKQVLPLLERQLARYSPRPHWGKLFAMTPEQVHRCYPRLQEFREIAHLYDPAGKFRNAFLDRYVFS